MKRLLKIHKFFYERNALHVYKQSNKLLWIICNVAYRLVEWIIMGVLYMHKYFAIYPQPLKNESGIIISLTSFSKRINNVWMVIDSMFYQKSLPERVFLYLSKEEFPNERKDLPQRLLHYENIGLEICFRANNLMPHKKYFYALQEHPDKCVITIDDDMYYRDDLVEHLLSLHKRFPNCICSNTIHTIALRNNDFESYKNWKSFSAPNKPSLLNCAIGCNGILYPPYIFKNRDVFDVANILKLSLRADDLWLKAHEILERIEVVSGEYYCAGPTIIGSQIVALMDSNCINNGNDCVWKILDEKFGLHAKLLNRSK